MDKSWQNTSNSSTGFIYFNTSSNQEYHSKSDTTDFLAFSDSPQVSPQLNKFKPTHYSSPQTKFHRGSPRNYPHNSRKYRRWSGGNRSLNSSNSSSYSQNTSMRESEQDSSSIERFLHPSFLEDPWAKLEAKLKEQKQINEEPQEREDLTT